MDIKFIFSSDYHFGISKYGKLNLTTGINTRIEEDFQQLDKIVDYTIKNKKDLFLVGGDIFNNRHPSDIVKKEFAKRLKRLIDNKITVIVLMGNHEGNIQGKAHCMSGEKILINSEYLHIIDDIKEIEYKGINILILPYFRKNINIENKIKSLKKKTLILGHFTIYGAKKDGFAFTKGNYIKPEIFNNKNVIGVFLGHIHIFQKIKNIIYSGSINKINFGDENDQKVFVTGIIKNKKCNWNIKSLDSREFLTINEIWDKQLKSRISKIDVKNKIVKINLKVNSQTAIIPGTVIKKYLRNKGAIIDSLKIERKQIEIVRDKKYGTELNPIKLLKYYLKKESNFIRQIGEKILNEINN